MDTFPSPAAQARAETLFERLERLENLWPDPPELPPELLEAALAGWRKAAARGDGPAFARRLDWDGIDPRRAAIAFAETTTAPDGAWAGQVERWLHAVGERSREATPRGGPPDVPFAELVVPWADEAAARAADGNPGLAAALAPGAWREWVGALARRLGWIAGLALYESFDLERRARGRAGAYGRFVARHRESGWRLLGETYPVLVRQLAGRAEDWIEATRELVTRLLADRPRLASMLDGGADPGRVVRLAAGLSDPHARGRRVVALTFESGLEVIWKPRPVELEAAWAGLCRDLRAAGCDLAPAAARVVVSPGCGWMERIAPEPASSAAAVDDWFRRAGAFAAFAWLLGARDLHAENLVATRRGPILVDAEMLLAPVGGASAEAPLAEESVLATGLLADPAHPAGPGALGFAGLDVPDPGALGEEDREWSGLGGDDLRLAWRRQPLAPRANVLWHEGRPQRPEAHAEAIADGFARALAWIEEHRAALLAPDGPLARFRGAATRILFRPSAQYATTLALSVRPRYLADGLAGSLLREALLVPFATIDARPSVWPLVAEERAALERLDVPVFRLGVEETALVVGEGSRASRVEGLFGLSGLAAAGERLRGFDAARACRQLAAALGPRQMGADEEERRLAAAAGTIVAALAGSNAFAAAPPRGASLRGLALYGGAAGRALFAAAAFRAGGGEAWRETAVHLAAATCAAIEDVPAGDADDARRGATDGWASLVWTFVGLAELLGDPSLLDAAGRAARRLARAPGDGSRWGWDVAAGEAGALLGWLTWAETGGTADALGRAVESGERLLAAQIAGGAEAGAWPTVGGGPALAGFAHGACGIARALDALASATGEARFRAAADRAYAWEHGVFEPSQRDWPARVAGKRPGEVVAHFLGSWCHGAPGIALGRVFRIAGDHGGAPDDLAGDLAAALDTAARPPLPDVDHLCCGTAGRLAALAAAARVLEDRAAAASGRRLARLAIARAEGRGGWAIPAGPVAGERPDLGLFRGFAGLAWSLFALTPGGTDLPIVAALELPSERARRRGQA